VSALPRRTYFAIALASAAVLMLQVVLNRIFSYTTWHHLAYISVSLALLGFGASGSVLAAFPRVLGTRVHAALSTTLVLAAVATLVMLVVVGTIPIHPTEVLTSPLELAKFTLYFAVVSVPFFFTGLAIVLALREAGPQVNVLYFWDLVGAGLGCAAVVSLLDFAGTPRAAIVVAALLALAGALAAGRSERRLRSASLAVGAVLLALAGPIPGALPFPPSKDKFIAPFVAGGYDYYSEWSALFRTDLMTAPDETLVDGGYRDVGISPNFEGEKPPFRLILHDGTAGAIMYRVGDDLADFDMFRHHILSTPYVLLDRPEVLVLGVGGGADIVNALVNGARRVVGAELDPLTVNLITVSEIEFTGGLFIRPDVTIVTSEGRHFVRSTPERFDLLQMSGVDTLAALSSGAYVLAENYLYTVESFLDFFEVLRPGGLVSVAAMDFHPDRGTSRHALRFASIALEALRARGVAAPHTHLAIIGETRGVAEFEVLTRLEPFTEAELARLEDFIEREGFQAWYLPGRPDQQLAPFRELLEGDAAARAVALERTFLDLRATTDDRPFFFSFYKWRHLFAHRAEVDPGHLLATGQLVLVLILVLAIAVSVGAIVLPLLRVRSRARELPGRFWFHGYFAALGAGFIFVEISFVQRFILFLGYPTYALSVVLFAFLTSAGLGAYASGRLPARPGRVLSLLVAALIGLTSLYAFGLSPVLGATLAAPLWVRVGISVALCAPLGGLLGTFFPYGIRLLAYVNEDFTPWAWATNGCLTVVGSVLSIILATTFGFTAVIALFCAIYAAGAASFVRGYRALQAG
jgi:hypothetical protein